ncbi:ABC transporter permease [Mycobacteroides abscessus subsp. abscessus]|uniref:ABC transporter permease n=1 Tax=Mycobacteroides abscessus TaxID=36809 RepID=UPI00094233BD|nr:ABC transporter permease [Mycobacteroides abscessus]
MTTYVAAPAMTQAGPSDDLTLVPARKPARSLTGFLSMTGGVLVAALTRPPAVREFFRQAGAIARVSVLPMCMVAIPLAVLIVLVLEALVFGPTGFPTHAVLVAAAAGATVVFAEADSARIQRDIGAMRSRGIDITHGFVVPRVLATAVTAVPLAFIAVAAAGVYFFSAFGKHTPLSLFIGNLLQLMSPLNILIVVIEAASLGLIAGLIACYRGATAT